LKDLPLHSSLAEVAMMIKRLLDLKRTKKRTLLAAEIFFLVFLLAACDPSSEVTRISTLEVATITPTMVGTMPKPTLGKILPTPTLEKTPPAPTATFESATPAPTSTEDYAYLGLTPAEVNSLLSLEQVDEYPLYTMHYFAEYEIANYTFPVNLSHSQPSLAETWACSLFAALADPAARLYGRNFDWEYSPAVLLFTDPPDGYDSVSMVDIAYLGFPGDQSQNLTEKSLDELVGLLHAPYIPFDGINEAGLAIGMAAVPAGNVADDPDKTTLGSLGVIRAVLDGAASVDEALVILQGFNIDFEGGPPIHYLIADTQGNAALLEHYRGEINVLRNQMNWYQATNFLNSSVGSPEGQCWRYDAIQEKMETTQGALTSESAMGLLREVSQEGTQWSVVYSISTGEVQVAMGRDYDNVHVFRLDMMEK
jgi:hypothetical protein